MISACLLAFNNAETVGTTITSVRPHVDEVVVYDTGSTDETLAVLAEIAAADGAPVRVTCAGTELAPALYGDNGALRDVAFARKLAFDLAAPWADWLMWLDADDEVVVECDLRDVTKAAPTDVDAFLVRYLCANDKQIWKPRLFRHGSLHWLGRVHGQMLPVAGTDGYDFACRWQHLAPEEFVVIHRGDDAYDEWKVRILRDEEEEAAGRGEADARVLLYLGHDAHLRGDDEEALGYFVRSALAFDAGFSPLAFSEIAALVDGADRPWTFESRSPSLCSAGAGRWLALLVEGVAAQVWGLVTSAAGVATALVELGFCERGAEIARELEKAIEGQPGVLNHFELGPQVMLACLRDVVSAAAAKGAGKSLG